MGGEPEAGADGGQGEGIPLEGIDEVGEPVPEQKS